MVKNFLKGIAVKKYSNINRMIAIFDKNLRINLIHSFHKIISFSPRKASQTQKQLFTNNSKSKLLKKIANEITMSSYQRKRRPSKSNDSSFEKSYSLSKSINHTSIKKAKNINLNLTKSSHQRVHTLNNSPDNIFSRLYQDNSIREMKKIKNTIDHINQEQKDLVQHSKSITRTQSQSSRTFQINTDKFFTKKNKNLEKLHRQKENILKESCTFKPTINKDKYYSSEKIRKNQENFNNIFEKLNEYEYFHQGTNIYTKPISLIKGSNITKKTELSLGVKLKAVYQTTI